MLGLSLIPRRVPLGRAGTLGIGLVSECSACSSDLPLFPLPLDRDTGFESCSDGGVVVFALTVGRFRLVDRLSALSFFLRATRFLMTGIGFSGPSIESSTASVSDDVDADSLTGFSLC